MKSLKFTKNFNQWGLMTNYSRKANPNATNSELDAKVIIKHPTLTSAQRAELIEQYVEIVVDRLSTEDLIQMVTEDLTYRYEDMSDVEFRDHVVEMENSGCPEDNLYDELVENIQITDLMKEVD